MKKIFFTPLILILLFTSCEDVVNVDLETAAPKLVIDASIDWEKGTTGNVQVIKLSTTSDFYSNTVPRVSGAIVFITNSSTANGVSMEPCLPLQEMVIMSNTKQNKNIPVMA
jgi:hypothetical protein